MSVKQPLISIIVPVYNVEDYLYNCIDSILAQTYTNLQIVLVNDGSTDSSGKILTEYQNKDDRIIVVNQKNAGVSAARNNGIAHATGEYIAFADSDDWIHPQMIEYLYKVLIENSADLSSVEIVRTSSEETGIKQPPEAVKVYNRKEYLKIFFKVESQEIIYNFYNKLYKRELLTEDLFPAYRIGEDVIATYKTILKAKKIAASNQKMYFYRQASGITSKFNENYFQLEQVWDDVCSMSEGKNLKYALLNRKRINFTLLSELAISGDYKKYKKKTKILLRKLRQDETELLHSKIAFSRKIMIVWFCVNYNSAAFLMSRLMKKRQ